MSVLIRLIPGALVVIGSFWAYQRGANDFAVFHEAWRLVLSGRGAEIYSATPDRYLYAPGFAWLLSPLGLLSRPVALGVWCLAKAAALGWMAGAFGRRLCAGGGDARSGFVLSALAVAFVARPLLIDFQYGQVNLLILVACVWALLTHFDSEKSGPWASVAWAVMAVAAVAKIFPLPVLLVPWFVTLGISGPKLWSERVGILVGLAAILGAPMVTEGWNGIGPLFLKWQGALLSRGFPTDSHNQSIAALLYHYFSGQPTHVLAYGPESRIFGWAILGPKALQALSYGWTALSSGLLLAWILVGYLRHAPLRWIAVLIGLLILPSHLVWKPYFIFSYPLAAIAFTDVMRAQGVRCCDRAGLWWLGGWMWSRWRWVCLGVLFILANLTTYDFVGYTVAGYLEAASVLMLVHLGLLRSAFIAQPRS